MAPTSEPGDNYHCYWKPVQSASVSMLTDPSLPDVCQLRDPFYATTNNKLKKNLTAWCSARYCSETQYYKYCMLVYSTLLVTEYNIFNWNCPSTMDPPFHTSICTSKTWKFQTVWPEIWCFSVLIFCVKTTLKLTYMRLYLTTLFQGLCPRPSRKKERRKWKGKGMGREEKERITGQRSCSFYFRKSSLFRN